MKGSKEGRKEERMKDDERKEQERKQGKEREAGTEEKGMKGNRLFVHPSIYLLNCLAIELA